MGRTAAKDSKNIKKEKDGKNQQANNPSLKSGYLCNNMDVAANTTTSSHTLSPTSKVTQAPESETPPRESDHVPEEHLSALLVAGISISFVFLFILVIICVWCARKTSKGSSAEINSVPSGEPGVSLKKISTHENPCEWPFERALQ